MSFRRKAAGALLVFGLLPGCRRGPEPARAWRLIDHLPTREVSLEEAQRKRGQDPSRGVFVFERPRGLGLLARVEVELESGRDVRLREICLGSRREAPDRVAALTAGSWKATLEHETRDVMVVPPT